MPNEGFLGNLTLSGERAATDDHPVILHHLPLSTSALSAAIPVGTVMKRVQGSSEDKAAWEPMAVADFASIVPVAVVDAPCDPTGGNEKSALCVVHGCVKAHLLKTSEGTPLTDAQIAKLSESNIFAV